MYESFVKTIISSVNNWLKSWIYGFAVKKLSFLMENGIMLRDFRLVEYLKRKKEKKRKTGHFFEIMDSMTNLQIQLAFDYS